MPRAGDAVPRLPAEPHETSRRHEIRSIRHDTRCRHSHRAGLYCRPVRRCVVVGPPGRQCGLLHGQPPHAVVHGGLCDDRGGDVGRYVHFGPGFCGRRLLLLHADGRGLYGGPAHRGLRPDPDVLPPAGCLALRIPRRPFRRGLAPHRSVVFLHFEDAGRSASGLRGVCGAATAGLRALRHSVLGQCPDHDVLRVALYVPGRGEVADLDRHAQNAVSGRESHPVDPLHHAGAGPFGGGDGA